MKVHLWAPGLYEQQGGIEAYSAALVKALVGMGIAKQVTVLAMHDRGATLRSHLPNGLRVAGTGGIPLRFRTAAFAALLTARAISGRPELIVTTHLHFGPVAAWLKQWFGFPYWISLHGKEAWEVKDAGYRRALRDADLLLPVSLFTRDRVILKQGLPPERFRILHDTFDPAAWKVGPKPGYLLERYKLDAESAVILTVGRLSAGEAYKGQDRVLRVLREVAEQLRSSNRGVRNVGREEGEIRNAEGETRKENGTSEQIRNPQSAIHNSNVRYLIVGDGDDRARLERIADEEGVRELVTFAGRVPHEELADHYRLCDLFAMPSTGEGFGIVFLEAMACGKPVLGGTRDAAVDALRGGELGVLVDPDDPAQLRDAIIAILSKDCSHPLIYQPEALRAKVVEYFGFEKFRETLAEILREEVGERDIR